MRQRRPVEDRFWSKVDKSGDCWIWIAAHHPMGYGAFVYEGKVRCAHRISWLLTHGDPGDLDVLHKCDNPPCVRPDHLFLGTHADNMADMAAKGRANRIQKLIGDAVATSKLTRPQVVEAIKRVRSGETQLVVCQDLGISPTQMSRIIRGVSWKHVHAELESA